MDYVWGILLAFARDHLLTTHNLFMLVGTWVLIWAAERPVFWLVSRMPSARQVTWWGLQKNGKALAGILWCELLVWVPTVQPPLCDGPVDGCQTVFGRIALGVVLGGGLSLLHKYVIARLKRAFGAKGTVVPPEVTKTLMR